MLNEIEGIGPGLMVQFKSKFQKVICFRRYVRGYSRLSGRTDLEEDISLEGRTNSRKPISRWSVRVP